MEVCSQGLRAESGSHTPQTRLITVPTVTKQTPSIE